MVLLLKKEARRMSQWLIMSLQREKWREESWILM